MKKKITAIALVVCLVAVAIVGGSLAYFTDTKTATNTFTVGNVSIILDEPNWNPDSSTPPQVYPGEVLAKNPTVTNNGANPCFVRIQVTGLNCLGNAGMIEYMTIDKEGQAVPGRLGDDWELNAADGYFYYTKALGVGLTTDALFDQIKIPANLTNGNGTTEFNVVVTAEAVQADGIVMEGATLTVADIVAWFNTCMPSTT